MESKKVRKCVVNNFCKTKPPSRILVSLGIIDDMNLKIKYNDVVDILDKLHNLRENILYMIGFEKLVREEIFEENNSEKIIS